ncbi:MAG: PHP domain-containing protein [Desulfobacterales bacterium]|nr:PHP domain-containing protein [Desulfobacterales bacterium]
MKRYRADMHIHTCLSPCGDLSMDPDRVVKCAVTAGLDLMVVSDHNSTANCRAVMEAAENTGLVVFPGCEVCTSEEVHLVVFFGQMKAAEAFQGYLSKHLSGVNRPDVFGYQIKADAKGNFIDECTDFLLGAVDESASKVAQEARACGGLVVCAHIDRRSFSVISQLGFIPEDLSVDAVEVTYPGLMDGFASLYGRGLPVVTSSDAHQPDAIGRWVTLLEMESINFEELTMAIASVKGRSICGYEERAGSPVWRGVM